MAGGVALYERALTYNAKHAKALYNLGVACGEMGHVSRAMFLYELAIHFDPSCAEAWNNLGVLQRDLGNFECERPWSAHAWCLSFTSESEDAMWRCQA